MMYKTELLHTCLLELLYETRQTTIMLTVGGGYGLFLKRQQLLSSPQATLVEDVQRGRSTNDLDLFLQTELLANPEQARYFSEALRRLEFDAVNTAKFYQFCRTFHQANQEDKVKIDLLTGPISSGFDLANLRIEDKRRVKPLDKTIEMHAHQTKEAVAIEDTPTQVVIQGRRFNGEKMQGKILLPNTFSYLMMKLNAFSDKESQGEQGNASKHAADVYQLLAVTTEQEWETAKKLQDQYSDVPAVRNVADLVQQQFTLPSQTGIVRMREYSDALRQIDTMNFSSILTELFVHP